MAYTFLEKGLKEDEIKLLTELENRWFNGEDVNHKTVLDIILAEKFEGDLFDAWKYWDGIKKPINRDSLRNPVSISEYLTGEKGCRQYYVRGTEFSHSTITEKTHSIIVNSMISDDVYFELIDDRLYVKYNQILGSIFIAKLKESKMTEKKLEDVPHASIVDKKPTRQQLKKFNQVTEDIRSKMIRSNCSGIVYVGIEGGEYAGGIVGDIAVVADALVTACINNDAVLEVFEIVVKTAKAKKV